MLNIAQVIGLIKRFGSGGSSSSGGSSVQPDWNQNDPAAADYVKNRTHYSETASKTVFDGEADGEQTHSPNLLSYNLGESLSDYPFSASAQYTIIFDGEVHTNLVAEEYSGTTMVLVRDAEFAASYGVDEPIYMWDGQYFHVFAQYIVYKHGGEMSEEDAGKYMRMSIIITEQTELPHPLDPKFLPPDITIPSGGSLTLAAGATVNDEAGVLGGSGGVEPLFVGLTLNEDGTCTSNVSANEVFEAVVSGRSVFTMNPRTYLLMPVTSVFQKSEGVYRVGFAGVNFHTSSEPFYEAIYLKVNTATITQYTLTARS